MSRDLTRRQVMEWRSAWSHADQRALEHALDHLAETDYYEPGSKQYVGARVGGRVALYIAPGYLYWTRPGWTDVLDTSLYAGGLLDADDGRALWSPLSTFRQHERSGPSLEELAAPCLDCFQVPSVSGACGCD